VDKLQVNLEFSARREFVEFVGPPKATQNNNADGIDVKAEPIRIPLAMLEPEPESVQQKRRRRRRRSKTHGRE
jgi:hypothetical protein